MSKINEYLITTMTRPISAVVAAGYNKLKTRTTNVGKYIDQTVTRAEKDINNTAKAAEKQTMKT